MRLTFILVLLITSIGYGQAELPPINTTSYGLNSHTNRDISYFTQTDSNKNVINLGTTERDSTHTDLVITKFDSNLNLSWQSRFSLDTDQSYDNPLDMYIASNNNVIIVGRSALNASVGGGLLFVVKYDKDGNLQWHKTIGNIDGSDYYDFSSYDSSFVDDVLRVSYTRYGESNNSPIYHITFDEAGNFSETLTTDFVNQGTKNTFKDGIFYSLVRINEDDGNFNEQYYLIRKSATIEEIYHLNYEDNFVFQYFTSVFDYYDLYVDDFENIFLIKSKVEGTGNVTYTKINKGGKIVYSVQLPENIYHIDSYLDVDDKLNLFYYDINSETVEKRIVDELGADSLLNQIAYSDYLGGDLKTSDAFFLASTTNNITLYNSDLNPVNSFQYSNFYELSDIVKIDDSNIATSGTIYDKIYPESDFLAQRNIYLEKINTTGIESAYMFSGEGTSKVVRPMVLVDHANNYWILSEEQTGPNNWQIGGSRSPINRSIYKYDSELNLIWRTELSHVLFTESDFLLDNQNNLYINTKGPGPNGYGYFVTKISPAGDVVFQEYSSDYGARQLHLNKDQNVIRVTWPIRNHSTYTDETHVYTHDAGTGELLNTLTIPGYEIIKSFTDSNGDSYMYMYAEEDPDSNNEHKLRLYKNLNEVFTIDPYVTGLNGMLQVGVHNSDIDNEGTLFIGSNGGHDDNRIHKVSLSGDYQYQDIENELTRMTVLDNGDVFFMQEITSDDGKLYLFDSDLNLLQEFSQYFFKNSILFEYKNFLFVNDYPFHEYTDYYVNVLNRDGQQIDKFHLPSNLSYAKIDQNSDLILTGTFGEQVYLYSFYGWFRGLLHKYSYDGPIDSDGDGIGDNVDECPDTPNGQAINESGCSQSQLDDDNDGVSNDIDQCPATPENEAVNEHGCAESELDDDGDGITNDIDQCPESVLLDLVNDAGCFFLPSDNFVIQTVSETCPGKKNGQIIINATENLNYVLHINGTNYDFTSTLTINDVAPSTYYICISVPEEGYEQCYNLTIMAGQNVSARISSVSNTTTISMDQGTAPFTVFKNNNVILHTWESSFSIQSQNGDLLEVKTAQECEGSLIKSIGKLKQLIVYPNPTKSNIDIIGLSSHKNKIEIKVYNLQSQLVLNLAPQIINNSTQLGLNNLPSGVYFIKFNDPDPITLKVIKE